MLSGSKPSTLSIQSRSSTRNRSPIRCHLSRSILQLSLRQPLSCRYIITNKLYKILKSLSAASTSPVTYHTIHFPFFLPFHKYRQSYTTCLTRWRFNPLT